MITGNGERKIKEYMFIDRMCLGYGWTKPKEGEEFWGIPYQWHSDLSFPFIEHREKGKVTRTVNALDISEIVFE